MNILFLICLSLSNGIQTSQLAHTYSIVAFDQNTGEIGGAVQSHWFSVGKDVLWIKAGVGVVATQSFVRIDYGPLGLMMMEEGKSPKEILNLLTTKDEARHVRQVGMVNTKGQSAGFTGKNCIAFASDKQGKYYSIQSNLMLKDTVTSSMALAFEQSKGSLADRLLAALIAAEAQGGDIRGSQSAAIKIAQASIPNKPWEGITMDLRVEDHPHPIKELKRLIEVNKGYHSMNQGDLAMEKNDIKKAIAFYKQAELILIGRHEPIFWHAVTLASAGHFDQALPKFKKAIKMHPHWLDVLPRLKKSGILTLTKKQEKLIGLN